MILDAGTPPADRELWLKKLQLCQTVEANARARDELQINRDADVAIARDKENANVAIARDKENANAAIARDTANANANEAIARDTANANANATIETSRASEETRQLEIAYDWRTKTTYAGIALAVYGSLVPLVYHLAGMPAPEEWLQNSFIIAGGLTGGVPWLTSVKTFLGKLFAKRE